MWSSWEALPRTAVVLEGPAVTPLYVPRSTLRWEPERRRRRDGCSTTLGRHSGWERICRLTEAHEAGKLAPRRDVAQGRRTPASRQAVRGHVAVRNSRPGDGCDLHVGWPRQPHAVKRAGNESGRPIPQHSWCQRRSGESSGAPHDLGERNGRRGSSRLGNA